MHEGQLIKCVKKFSDDNLVDGNFYILNCIFNDNIRINVHDPFAYKLDTFSMFYCNVINTWMYNFVEASPEEVEEYIKKQKENLLAKIEIIENSRDILNGRE